MKNGYTFIELMIVVTVGLILVSMVGCGALVIKGCNHIADRGVKNVVSDIMEGRENRGESGRIGENINTENIH